MKNRNLPPCFKPAESVGVKKTKQKKGFSWPQVAPGGGDFPSLKFKSVQNIVQNSD